MTGLGQVLRYRNTIPLCLGSGLTLCWHWLCLEATVLCRSCSGAVPSPFCRWGRQGMGRVSGWAKVWDLEFLVRMLPDKATPPTGPRALAYPTSGGHSSHKGSQPRCHPLPYRDCVLRAYSVLPVLSISCALLNLILMAILGGSSLLTLQMRERGSETWRSQNPIHSFIHSLIYSFIHSLTHSLTHPFSHSFTHSFSHSFTHSLTHPFVHEKPLPGHLVCVTVQPRQSWAHGPLPSCSLVVEGGIGRGTCTLVRRTL